MNNISITNVRVSDYKDGSVVGSSMISTGLWAYFKGGELVRKSPLLYQNYYFDAYGKMADKILKMNLRNGSYVNIVGKLSNRPDKNGGLANHIEVLSIEFSYSYSGNQKETENQPVETVQTETTQENKKVTPIPEPQIKSSSIDLDKNDIFASLDIDSVIFS